MSDRLHRLHVGLPSGKGGASVDIGPCRWRGDGPDPLKPRVARRIALTWNLCDGWPTEVLEEGALRDVFDLARELADVVVAHEHAHVTTEMCHRARRLLTLFADLDTRQDLTDGRPADCDRCYPVERDEP